MKAVILQYDDVFKVYLCNGKIDTLSAEDVVQFLKTYNDESQYVLGDNDIDFTNTLEKPSNNAIVSVTDDYRLIFHNHAFFHKHILPNKIDYITVEEFAEKHERNIEVIRRYCRNDKIEGIYKEGNTWYIPKNAKCPVDGRSTRTIRKKKTDMN